MIEEMTNRRARRNGFVQGKEKKRKRYLATWLPNVLKKRKKNEIQLLRNGSDLRGISFYGSQCCSSKEARHSFATADQTGRNQLTPCSERERGEKTRSEVTLPADTGTKVEGHALPRRLGSQA